MNWLESIFQSLLGGSTAAPTTGPYGYDAPNFGQTGQDQQSIAIPAGAGTSAGGLPGESTGGFNQSSPILSALGKIDLSKFSHPQGGSPMQPGHAVPLTTLPTFPDVGQGPTLEGLVQAIQARRQRLAALGVGG